ncbi:hypothetical protein [Flaviflexus huanghaiensis]|uniref:hypothetical protein n=1 Tax=Flaviflexus huanghaiensis TaxID=1111473 RepID=UPI0015FB0CA3|nr:hypothetical protein [Flaviflexus huanghaiensis]
MNWGIVGIIAAAVLLILAVIWVLTARRLDRLHRTVIQSRLTLNEALTQRATASAEFAACGALDVASVILLADAAQNALAQSHQPIASDGLEAGPGYRHVSRDSDDDRLMLESNLSRTLRLVHDGLDEDELSTVQQKAHDILEDTRENVRLARRFHNAFVDQTRRLRVNPFVRAARMAGGAPMPRPVDMDDE